MLDPAARRPGLTAAREGELNLGIEVIGRGLRVAGRKEHEQLRRLLRPALPQRPVRDDEPGIVGGVLELAVTLRDELELPLAALEHG